MDASSDSQGSAFIPESSREIFKEEKSDPLGRFWLSFTGEQRNACTKGPLRSQKATLNIYFSCVNWPPFLTLGPRLRPEARFAGTPPIHMRTNPAMKLAVTLFFLFAATTTFGAARPTRT